MSVFVNVIGTSESEATTTSDPFYLTWTLTLSAAASSEVEVGYRFLSGSAQAGSDAYDWRSGTSVTFLPGETSKTVSYRIDGDSLNEPDETIVLEVFEANGATLAGNAPVLRSTGWILDDDSIGDNLALFASNPVVVEGDSGQKMAVFEISLSRPAPEAFSVVYTTVDGTARAGQDYTATSGTIDFAEGQTVASVEVPVLGDRDVEPTEIFTLDISAPDLVAQVSDGMAELLDDDAGAPTVSVSSAAASEATTTSDPFYLTWTLTLSAAASSEVEVGYRFLSGSAQAGSDAYDWRSGTSVTFLPGETSKTVSYRIDGDSLNEPDETIVLEVFEANGATLAGNAPVLRSTGWILDDDSIGDNLALFASNPVVVEGDSGQKMAVFEISLSRPAPEAFSVVYTTVDGTARAGQDYTATSGTIDFAEGQTVASVEVPVLGDRDVEPTEIFTLDISAPDLVAQVSDGMAELLDDDAGAPTVSVSSAAASEATTTSDPFYLTWTLTLSAAASSEVEVGYRFLSGSAQAGSDAYDWRSGTSVTFLPGETSKTVSYRIDGDSLNEPDETIVLEVFEANGATLAGNAPVLRSTGWILDDDSIGDNLALFASNPVVVEGDSGQKMAVFEISLSRPAPEAFSVVYTTVDGTARAGQDYTATSGTIDFAEGQTVASVEVPVLGDRDVEPTEIFTLDISAPDLVAQVSDGMAELLDDDAGAPTVSVSSAAASEATTTSDPFYLTWTLTLSAAASSEVEVGYRFLSGSAQAGSDAYDWRSGTSVTFLPGETSKTVSYRIDGDSLNEPDETIVLEVFEANGATLAGNAPVLRSTGWILDDDSIGDNLALFASNPVVVEGDSGQKMAVFEISLSRPAPEAFSVVYTTVDGTARAGQDYTATSGTIDFAEGQTVASVEVPVLGDRDVEPTEIFTLDISAPDLVAQVSDGMAEIRDTDVAGLLIEGTPGRDVLDGQSGADTIRGFEDNDILRGAGGDDLIEAGDGADTVNGGDGDDLIRGGATEADLRDVVFAGDGNDSVDGGYGNDELYGQDGNDTLAGGFGADTVQGQDGDDVITGSAFSDVVFGGDGDDFVNGGFGSDRINGGDGADRFFHEGIKTHGSDWVQDYVAADGDTLFFGISGARREDFRVTFNHTANADGERAGDDAVQEAFVRYNPDGIDAQTIWALVDGGGQSSINLQISGDPNVYDLLG